MTREELSDPPHKYEWTVSSSRRPPAPLLRARAGPVSAFSNTAGGWRVFGVRYAGESFKQNSVRGLDLERVECRSSLGQHPGNREERREKIR